VRTLRIVSSAIVLGFLVDQTQFAYAGPATHFTLRLNNSTIPWAFPPPEGLSSGLRREMRQSSSGTVAVDRKTVASG
jgi:hypothetical protein